MGKTSPQRWWGVAGWLGVGLCALAFTGAADLLLVGLGRHGRLALLAAMIAGAALTALVWWAAPRLIPPLDRVGAALAAPSTRVFAVGVVALAFVLRAAWISVVPPAQTSDYGAYMHLARSLAAGGPYFDPGPPASYAFWPPGYPALLALPMTLTGGAAWTPLVLNSLLFVVAAGGTWALGVAVGLPVAGRAAALLLAIWPNLVTYGGLAAKEHLSLALLPIVLLTWWRARGGLSLLGVGLLAGALAMTQGSWVLLPAALAAHALVSTRSWGATLRRTAPVAVGVVIILAPWAARNHRVLGAPVLLTTNSGPNLYRGNHEGASGGYAPLLPETLEGADEIERAENGRQRAKAWIAANPLRFVTLAFHKQRHFMGDDTTGLYDALRFPYGGDDRLYAALKLLFTGWWVGIWALVLIALRRGRPETVMTSRLVLPALCIVYLLAVHSVYHSIGRFHVPVAGMIALLAGWALTARPPRPLGLDAD